MCTSRLCICKLNVFRCRKWIKMSLLSLLTVSSRTTNGTFMLHLHSPEVLIETSTFPLYWVKHEPSSTDISKYFYKRNNNKKKIIMSNWTYFSYADWPVSSLCETKMFKCFALVWHYFDNTHVKTYAILSFQTEGVLMFWERRIILGFLIVLLIWIIVTCTCFCWENK